MADKKQIKREKPVSEAKTKSLNELVDLIKKNNTLLVASVKNLPGRQYQSVKHKVRENAKVKLLKKSLMLRAIEKVGKEMSEMKEYVKEDCAFLFSNQDPFELSAILSDNLSSAKAKIGQIVPEDIKVNEGPTDLVPGPVISEFGALGIPIQIEDGKIHIKKAKVILKAGEKVTAAAAGMMSKLDIKPFKIGYEPIAAYDAKAGKVYKNIRINKEETLSLLKDSYSRALAFSVKVAYVTSDNLKFILAKANSHYMAIANKIGQTGEAQADAQNKTEENQTIDETQNKTEGGQQ